MSHPLARLSAALADRYRLEHELGAGGMATVYLAADLKHDRKVAIKVLKPELAAVLGAERFVQEIKTTAALSHPHILPLFDSGEADGFLYYVMPYIEGETIREKLTRETQFGVEEAVRITTEVADALDYAHRHGVIHRDIKPENILLHDGRPMVMDFGIALAVSAAAGGRMTETGLSLGTPHYMSPEQATADKDITARSDIYSVASVLYEMLAGQPPHLGGSAQQVIMKIVTDVPRPVTDLRKSVPLNVAAALAKALEKLPADRFDSAARFVAALNDRQFALEGLGSPSTGPRGRGSWAAWLRDPRSWAAIGAAVMLGGLLLGRFILGAPAAGPVGADEPSRRFTLVLPDSLPLVFVGGATLGIEHRALDLSKDGRLLAYVAETPTGTSLVLADLTDRSFRVIEGTEGAFSPSFSPDGRSIAFLVGTELRRVAVAGGSPAPVAVVGEPYGATWVDSSRIFVPARQGSSPVLVDIGSGRLDTLPDGPTRAGMITPSGEGILYGGGNQLWYYDLGTRSRWALTDRGRVRWDSISPGDALHGFSPRLLPSGVLAYVQPGGALVALPVDPETLRPEGPATQVETQVRYSGAIAQLASSEDGLLVAATTPSSGRTTFEAVTSEGKAQELGLPPDDYGSFKLSPDGTRLAAIVYPPAGPPELRVFDLGRRSWERIYSNVAYGFVWTADGTGILLTAGVRGNRGVLLRVSSDGAQVVDTLLASSRPVRFATRDGRLLGIADSAGFRLVPVDSLGSPGRFVAGGGLSNLSPDGAWMAQTETRSGRSEVYVLSAVSTPAQRLRVSVDGGEEPRWTADGRTIVYRSGTRFYASAFTGGDRPGVGAPRLLFSGPYENVGGYSHDLFPDGRHLVLRQPGERTTRQLVVVTNAASAVRPAPDQP